MDIQLSKAAMEGILAALQARRRTLVTRHALRLFGAVSSVGVLAICGYFGIQFSKQIQLRHSFSPITDALSSEDVKRTAASLGSAILTHLAQDAEAKSGAARFAKAALAPLTADQPTAKALLKVLKDAVNLPEGQITLQELGLQVVKSSGVIDEASLLGKRSVGVALANPEVRNQTKMMSAAVLAHPIVKDAAIHAFWASNRFFRKSHTFPSPSAASVVDVDDFEFEN